MRPVLSLLADAAADLAFAAVLLAFALVAVVGTLHANGYRLSLYTVAPCAPAIPAAPHALSSNPLRATP